MATGSGLDLDRMEDGSIRPEVSFEKVEMGQSCGSFAQGGRLFLFTVQEVDPSGHTENLSMDSQQRAKVQDTLIRLFQANEVGARKGYGSYLGAVDREFTIALNTTSATPIKVGDVGLEKEMVGFLKGQRKDDDTESDSNRCFNFLRDLQRTVLTRSYQSTYLDTLTDEERKERAETLQKLDKMYDDYDSVITNLRSSKYADFKERNENKQGYWLKPQTLHTIAQDLAVRHSKDDARSQYRVIEPLAITSKSKDFSAFIAKVKALAQEEGVKGIAIPVHEFYKSDEQAAVYGIYIDVSDGHVYFYNPSVAKIKDDEPISLFTKELAEAFTEDEKKAKITSKRISCHQGFHPWEPIRQFKQRIKPIEKRSFQEEKEMTYFSDEDNHGRYVLKFFDEMLKHTDKDKAYSDFVSQRIRREQIEDFADDIAKDLERSYNRRYAEAYAFVKV